MQIHKTPEGNPGENLGDPEYGGDFLDITPKARLRREIIDMLKFIKIKTSFSVRGTVKKMRRQATNWVRTFAKDTLIHVCYPKYGRNS